MIKDRYGVVNVKRRAKYEKKFHLAYGYEFASFNRKESIRWCIDEGGVDHVVEKISTSYDDINKMEIIHRNED